MKLGHSLITLHGMDYNEAKLEFINSWGSMGPNWGISRTMAQIHALLLISPDSLTTEEVMDQLSISRGNANMNLHELMNWNLIYKKVKTGDRKDYFEAEKEPWKIAKNIAIERRKREIAPLMKTLENLSNFEGDGRDRKIKSFKKSIQGLQKMTQQTDDALQMVIRADESWFWSKMLGMIKILKD